MYDLLLKIMEPKKDKVSFFNRMVAMHEFFEKHGLYEEMWEPQPDVPMTFIWAISTKFPEIFEYQLGSMLQMHGIFNWNDQFVFVVDAKRSNDAIGLIGNLGEFFNTKIVVVRREFQGDRPTFNWDIGLDFAENDRAFFIRDLALFFQPWDTVLAARQAEIEKKLFNFSIILGPLWSRFCEKWLYLLHPQYSPGPFLFGYTARVQDVKSVNGFDQVFRRGFDHMGELDFLLRWQMKGYEYEIANGDHLFHPGLAADQNELQEMQHQSSINRRYFFDRYGEDLINSLPQPYRLETQLIEVNHAKTLDPLSQVIIDKSHVDVSEEQIKDAFSFAKRPNEDFIVEVI